jgi:hypothetical protein
MSGSNLKQISGLWLKEKKNGGKMMTGSLNAEALETLLDLGPCNLLIFKNDRKEEGSKQPDYQLFVAPKEDGGGRQSRQQRQDDDWP